VLVRLANSGNSFEVTGGEMLFDAARKASLNLPHSCLGGNCGACKARLLQGEIHYAHGTPLGLSAAEAAEGMILLCQAQARSDLVLETFDIRTAGSGAPKRLPCRIDRAIPLSHDVIGLFLRLPVAEDFSFAPGQYIDILLPGGRRRAFSIASPPHAARPLELHVRRVAGGEFTDRLFRGELQSSLLNIEGPLGTFVYREHATPAPPMLLIGGGTGIAPLLSMLRHVVETGAHRDMRLYWGVRSEQDLYAQATIAELTRQITRRQPGGAQPLSTQSGGAQPPSARSVLPGLSLQYMPVLSEAPATWTGLTGWVHEAALRDTEDLALHEVYAAGPPAMIDAIRGEYAARGVSTNRLHFDSFDYAPDTLERQRMSAATKS
jgi:CDP-4-dehydro-6-deoxyglucose reductase, E3